MTPSYSVDFLSLPAKTQAKLKASIDDETSRVHRCQGGKGELAWYAGHGAGALLALLSYVSALSAGYGDPLTDAGWQHPGALLLEALLLAALLYCLLAIGQRLLLWRRFGFRPGLYLLPFELVDARQPRLVIHDLAALTELKGTRFAATGRTRFDLHFAGGVVQQLWVRNSDRADVLADILADRQAALREAAARRDADTLNRLDPFHAYRVTGWRLPPVATAPAWRRALGKPAPLAVLAAALCAPPAWLLRNVGSDAAMAQQARALKTEEAYVGYIARGWRHVDALRADLPRVAYADVKRKKSASALRALLKRYPNDGLDEEIRADIHQLYQDAWTRFQKQAATAEPALLPMMERLLQLLEQQGRPDVYVRFHGPSAHELYRLDDDLARTGRQYPDKQMIPAAVHFTHTSAAAREARIVTGLQDGFRTIFASDLLAITVPARADLPGPSLDISYDISPSGTIYSSDTSNKLFVGLESHFVCTLAVPDVPEPWQFSVDVVPPDHFNVNYTAKVNLPNNGPEDSKVYAIMAERAFDALASKLRGAFFRPDSDAFVRYQRVTASTVVPVVAPASVSAD